MGERLRNDVQHAHAALQKWDVVVAHVAQTMVRRGARAEEAAATELGGIKDTCIAQARLGTDQRVEEPAGVGEVGAHKRARRAEEVKQDEVLDHRERRCGRRGRH